ncbi:DUF4320 family protein [Acetobacterium sp.]|uniref:DUF4320 family protein n=1 Tax=Acetobacterium sp. TaxID=1872094 RepID=UPI002F3E9B97
MKKILKSDDGFAYIDAILVFVFAMLGLSLILGVLPVFMQKQNLDYMAHEVIKTAEVQGNTGAKALERYNEVQDDTGLEPESISFDGTEHIGATKNVQINDTIRVTLISNFSLFNGYLMDEGINIELSSTATGRSGVYYK